MTLRHRIFRNTLNALSKWPQCIKKASYLKVMDVLVSCIPEKAHDFNTQEISNTLNALSKWPERTRGVFYLNAIDALIDCIPEKSHDFNAQEIANTLNALSKWPRSMKRVFYSKAIDMLVEGIPERADDFNAQNISNTLNALSKWPNRIKEMSYLKAINALVDCIPERANTFDLQNIANILNAFTKWSECMKKSVYSKAIDILVEGIPERADDFNAQIIVSLALTGCLFQLADSSNFLLIKMREIIKNNEKIILKELDPIIAKQFCQIHRYQPDLMTDELETVIKSDRFKLKFKSEKTIQSKLQQSIFQQLIVSFPKTEFINEYFIDFTRVDIACPKEKILIQVNGPDHYVGKILNLSSQFNKHLFEKLGWSVVIIPYFDWDELSHNKDKQIYLEKKVSSLLKWPLEENRRGVIPCENVNVSDFSSVHYENKKEKALGLFKRKKQVRLQKKIGNIDNYKPLVSQV
ncbi:RAP domain-containing protein [Rickettsiella grylli]|uniref:RAP domain-containing protein n=1 Tax=Rickettsiella grylli TaxID=59196 RepID=UPI001F11FA57|nr:RAP domain-containing protein [Rickettsiella grylli]